MQKKKVTNCIFKAIDSISDQFKLEKSLDTTIFIKGGTLDSFGLVSFIVAVEEQIEKEFNLNLVLADEKALQQKVYPFSTVDTLTDYVLLLLGPEKEMVTPKKIVIVDLDDTLWEGIVGDDGIEGIKVYGKYVELQKQLKTLKDKGILLAISSKNNESIALNAINKHSDMILKEDDFVSRRINWDSKADNISIMMKELNLGIESALFIDDNIREREVVKGFLPEITVSDKLDLDLFNTDNITPEDTHRMQMYKIEKDRKSAKEKMKSIDEWLHSLNTVVSIENLNDSNVDRIVQLLNKTNQMNLSTRRIDKHRLQSWVKVSGRTLWAFRVSDKFGDSGIVGIASITVDEKIVHVIDFVLSCRVMGRKIEETMLYTIMRFAKLSNMHEVVAKYIPTPKNKPCFDFWQKSGFTQSGGFFSYPANKEYIIPDCIKLVGQV